jgi:hypothetical protein
MLLGCATYDGIRLEVVGGALDIFLLDLDRLDQAQVIVAADVSRMVRRDQHRRHVAGQRRLPGRGRRNHDAQHQHGRQRDDRPDNW